MENYCNNCGKVGHVFSNCKLPIISIGIICFRYNNNKVEYLMIRRKETLGFIEFMRGKYAIQNKEFLLNLLRQMTNEEKDKLLNRDFETLWKEIWCDSDTQMKYKYEENTSKEKFNLLREGITYKSDNYTLKSLIEESKEVHEYDEPEWGFPKGRRNYNENDYDCAVREFCEETGFSSKLLHNLQNIVPYDENFTGSNFKSYKHKYFIMYMKYENSLVMNNYQKSEVSKMQWMDLNGCNEKIRSYNLEKKMLIKKVNNCLEKYAVYES
jgi:ADP-ribose pyrophosphatase YjhB (NUDIX family)